MQLAWPLSQRQKRSKARVVPVWTVTLIRRNIAALAPRADPWFHPGDGPPRPGGARAGGGAPRRAPAALRDRRDLPLAPVPPVRALRLVGRGRGPARPPLLRGQGGAGGVAVPARRHRPGG